MTYRPVYEMASGANLVFSPGSQGISAAIAIAQMDLHYTGLFGTVSDVKIIEAKTGRMVLRLASDFRHQYGSVL